MVIDLRKPKVLKGLLPKRGQEGRGGGLKAGAAFAKISEQRDQLRFVIQRHKGIIIVWDRDQ
jgi:hypothetical protein